MTHAAPLIPTLRYRDANAAVEWLCRAFGLSEHKVFRNEAGHVVHAELALGGSIIMLGPVADTEFGRFMKQPGDVGGVTTSIYAVVADPDTHCAQAQAAGALILMEPRDQNYGGRDYTCRDPEGHIWSFGTYDPWKARHS